MNLHIDIETYSSIGIKTSGVYKYTQSIDFEILLIAYALDDSEIQIVDLTVQEIPEALKKMLLDPEIQKFAHNANFERQAFKQIGIDIPIEQWSCSMVKAAYCGLPLGLEMLSGALGLEEKGKLSTGKTLIRYFCIPCKPTKVNEGRTRNFPTHDLEKWEAFKTYCIGDVEAEREVIERLGCYTLPTIEKEYYILDQQINDRGIEIDIPFVEKTCAMDARFSKSVIYEMKKITGLDNPNSAAQLKTWLSDAIGEEITTLVKDSIPALMKKAGAGIVSKVLNLRTKSSKSSTKKYTTMLNCVCENGRAHGLFQFYGAFRTGRWAGRLIQVQNLRKNELDNLATIREFVSRGDYSAIGMLYDDTADVLSQLVRTSFVAGEGRTFAVADFSAIEARVIAWLADEKWRLDVFASHGKIYEASASAMFNVPIEEVTKGSSLRSKGKIAELALGYGGALGALKQMDKGQSGLDDNEMNALVRKWRKANPAIVKLWKDVEGHAKKAIKERGKIETPIKNLIFESDGAVLTIQLPSGRKLFYQSPGFAENRFGALGIRYKGVDQKTKQWGWVDTYGGKLVENIVQAISRDILAHSMLELDYFGHDINMHVHDEVVCEVVGSRSDEHLKNMIRIMDSPISWAPGLILKSDGYITPFYKKD